MISGEIVKTKAVGNEKLGWFKVFPYLQDHLGQKSVGHPGFPALMAVGGADRFLEDLSKDDTRN